MKKKILVVDDEINICLLLENFLSQDYEVMAIHDGEEALQWLEGNLPDLIISDIQMTKMNGFEFLERIGPAPFPGIIFITAYDEFALKAFEFHALDYLLKPYDRERFTKAVEHARTSLRSKVISEDPDEQIKALLHSMNNNILHKK